MPLSGDVATAIKGTAGCMDSNAEKVTSKMYTDLFAKHPDMKGIFDQAKHQPGADGVSPQARNLANALKVFAKNCDNESALMPTVTMIAKKHKELGIKDDHFAPLGEVLLASMKEVCGCDDAVLGAWKEGYGYFAGLIMAETKK